MRALAISSAYAGCQAAILDDGHEVAAGEISEEMGLAAALPALIERLLDTAGRRLDLVAVVVGPGSFTGLRAGIAVATGVALALSIPVIGVTVAEALAGAVYGPDGSGLDGRVLWTAIAARRGRVFIDRGAGFAGWPIDAIPLATQPIAVCGNAANAVSASLAARGGNVMLTDARTARPDHVAEVAQRRMAGELPPLPAIPLYIDAPEARLPAGGLRAAPV